MILKNGVVFRQKDIYCGWPANHGAWQWGDEFLVGFLVGKYGRKSMHYCIEPFKKLLARSLDGGDTWEVSEPNMDFECEVPSPNAPNFNLEGDTIIRVCGCYDHGGDYCAEEGGYYLSTNRGHFWTGPFSFCGLEEQFAEPFGNTSRTRTLGNLVFLSRNTRGQFATDESFVAKCIDGKFELIGTICSEDARAVMPAVAKLPSGELVAALRRRHYHRRECWIDVFGSNDEGKTWHFLSEVGHTGGHNGNPPALLATPDGRLVCAYANRTDQQMKARVSNDGGKNWELNEIILATGETDIGYPQLFLRNDGTIVCVYYFADSANPQQSIVFTQFSLD